MTRYLVPDGKVHIIWDSEAEPVDWTTPNIGDGIDDEYCERWDFARIADAIDGGAS